MQGQFLRSLVPKQWFVWQLPNTSVQGRRGTDSIADSVASAIATDHSDHDCCGDTISNSAVTACTAGPRGLD